jgi:hypothetical protein
MPKRVLIKGGSAAALQVSLPGFDVTTATLDQMAFDARFANLTVIMKGALAVTQNNWQTIYFPQAYPVIPRALVNFQLNEAPAVCSMPAASLTNHGAYNYWHAVLMTNSYCQIGTFVASDPDNFNFGSGVAYYTFYK